VRVNVRDHRVGESANALARISSGMFKAIPFGYLAGSTMVYSGGSTAGIDVDGDGGEEAGLVVGRLLEFDDPFRECEMYPKAISVINGVGGLRGCSGDEDVDNSTCRFWSCVCESESESLCHSSNSPSPTPRGPRRLCSAWYCRSVGDIYRAPLEPGADVPAAEDRSEKGSSSEMVDGTCSWG